MSTQETNLYAWRMATRKNGRAGVNISFRGVKYENNKFLNMLNSYNKITPLD